MVRVTRGGAVSCVGFEEMSVRPDNDNMRLLSDWMTLAEFYQWIRKEKKRLCRELAADSKLWGCPEHRRTWNITIAMERWGLQRYGGG